MSEIGTTYKDIAIAYREINDEWYCEIGRAQTLSALKRKIDAHLRKQKSFNPIAAIHDAGRLFGGFEKVTITSLAEDGAVWVKNSKGARKKLDMKYGKLFEDSKENRAKVEQCNELTRQIHELGNKQKEIIASMEMVVLPKV